VANARLRQPGQPCFIVNRRAMPALPEAGLLELRLTIKPLLCTSWDVRSLTNKLPVVQHLNPKITVISSIAGATETGHV